jgi:predicted amidohydrolase YtcJ
MYADLVLRGATMYTMDTARPRARALAIAGGRIAACADANLDELVGPHTRVFDLPGRAVVPGFVDAHIHFGSYALTRDQVDLDQAASIEDGLRLLRAASERLDAEQWLRGRGWDRNRWGRLPAASDLDRAVGGRPAVMSSHDGHSMWLNSAALRAVGLDADTNPPPGGLIERDRVGQPTGVLFEDAQNLVRGRIPEPTDAELTEAIRRTLPVAAAAGLTGIHNLEDSRSRRAFQALESDGDLTLRVYHGLARGELRTAADAGLKTGVGSEWLRIGPVKLFADGALGSRTAHMLDPYEGREAHDGYRGIPTIQSEELAEAMCMADAAQLDLAVHAIGDAAVRSVLDAYELTRPQRLLRIEHAQLIHPDDVSRFSALGVVASMQPIHATADWRTADTHWGARARYGYAWRDLLNAGAALAFGTDAPVERLEPLRSLYAATTRIDPTGEPAGGWYPAQRLSLDEAVRAYTTGSAVAERAEHRRGSLSPGKDADLVVLSPDPFPLAPEALLSTRVELTVAGGRITFQGETLES